MSREAVGGACEIVPSALPSGKCIVYELQSSGIVASVVSEAAVNE